MYKAAIRMLIRRHIAALNAGDAGPLLRMAAADAELCFPGENHLAGEFRPRRDPYSTAPYGTHSTPAEIAAFADHVVANKIRIGIEDILVNGPPWNTRVCVRATDHIVAADGTNEYANRAALLITARWGKLVRWEDYLDTQRVQEWEQATGRALAAR